MTSLERVSLALSHKEPDRVPVYPILSGVSRLLTGASYYDFARDPKVMADCMGAVTEKFDLDIICTLTDLSVEASDFGQELEYPDTEAARPTANRFIKDSDDYGKIKVIPMGDRMKENVEAVKILSQKYGKEKPIVSFVFGPLGVLSMLRGQADMYLDLLDDPDAVKQAVQNITDTLYEYCDRLIDAGSHAIMFDTLFSSASIMRKTMWAEFEGVFIQPLCEHVHKRGAMVMIHNCGNGIYFDRQIEFMAPEGISFLYPPDDCKDFAECKKRYGNVTTLIGCVNPTWLPSASAKEIEEECIKEMDIMAPGGGFVLATGCEYPANLSFDAASVMAETAKKYKY
ncbi:MAG: uroporphyrinogen decarboxylase family protein [Armatimonadetes bacterium]|nr:uroporphyrinogen decarboxylase family protein [Candidatus Hippobium faecium]